MHHTTARPQRLSHVAQPGDRIREEHRAEARKREVVLIRGQRDLGVAARKGHIGQATALYVLTCIVEKCVAAVDPNHLARRPNQFSELDRGVTEAAAHVENPVAFADGQKWKYRFAMLR